MKNNEKMRIVGSPAATGRLRAAMYLRISSEDSDIRNSAKTESDSIANQRSLLSAFISRMPELEDADVVEFCEM